MTHRIPAPGTHRPSLTSAFAIAGLVLLLSACAYDPVTRDGSSTAHPMEDFRVTEIPAI
jgi:hypothetical protein